MFWPIKRHRLRIYPEERERIVALLLEKRNSTLVARLVGRSRTPIARIVKEEAIELWGDCVWYNEEKKNHLSLKKGFNWGRGCKEIRKKQDDNIQHCKSPRNRFAQGKTKK